MTQKLYAGQIYHICNKSIAGFRIFKKEEYSERFYNLLDYYNNRFVSKSYSDFTKFEKVYERRKILYKKENRIVKILGYCLMPDHYHMLFKVLDQTLVSLYIANIENSFTRYFNLKSKRKGPLWQSRFRRARIKTNEQLLHVSRYIHLNPTTAGLVKNPGLWKHSSYNDYIEDKNILGREIKEISIETPRLYKKFCEAHIDYQKSLALIKKALLE